MNGTGREAGKPEQVGSLQSPKTCHEARAEEARTSHTFEGKVRWSRLVCVQRLPFSSTQGSRMLYGDDADDTDRCRSEVSPD
jgi:hypothetical protein